MPTPRLTADFLNWAKDRPDAQALRWAGSSVSYAELAAAVTRLAADCAALGPTVCVPAEKHPAGIALILAAIRSGKRVLLLSPTLGEVTVGKLCERAGASHILATATPELDAGLVATPTGHPAGEGEQTPGLLLTTSGSTGLPKIVPIAEDGLDRFAAWARDRFAIGPGSVVLNYAPLNFDLCLLDVWTTLASGGRVELVETAKATDGPYLLRLLAEGGVTFVQAVPTFFRLLVDAATGPVSGVEHVLSTGDCLSPKILSELPALFPRARIYNLYGCTETNDSFLHEVDLGSGEHTAAGGLPIGDPLPNVDGVLVDADGAVVAGAGTGDLLVSTPFQAGGYLDPELDAGRWVPGPAGARHRAYFRSGDVARRDDDGRLWLLGRADDQVKVRGVLTNLKDVERILSQHPDVTEAAVTAVPDEVAGAALHATACRRSGSGLNSLQLRSYCASLLPRTAIPGALRIVDDPLPKTSTGKVARKKVPTTGERSA